MKNASQILACGSRSPLRNSLLILCFLLATNICHAAGASFNVKTILPLQIDPGLRLDDVNEVDQLTNPALLPDDIDHLVYTGENDVEDLLNRDGEPIISRHSVDQLHLVIALARLLDVPVYIKGHVAFANTGGSLYSRSRIFGHASSPGVIHFMNENAIVGLQIKEGATDVEIRDLTFNEVKDLRTAALHLAGDNINVAISGNTFKGVNVEDLQTNVCHAILITSSLVKDIRITDNDFNGFQYGVHCTCPAQQLMINRNRFKQWNHFAIRIGREGNILAHRSEDITISGNDFRNVARGLIRSVILVTRGESLLFVHDVEVSNNLVYSGGGSFVLGELGTATGDQIVLHGVIDFKISGNRSYFGGENGITASRLSRNGIISNNFVYANDTHGINIGSGYYEMAISPAADFAVGDEIEGAVSGTKAIIERIDVHPADGRTIFGLTRIIGGSIFRPEEILNLSKPGVSGQSSVIDRTKHIRILNNRVWNNGLDRIGTTPFTYGIFVTNADSISLRRNRIFNPDYAAKKASGDSLNQLFPIRLSNSRNIFVSDDNIFERGALTPAQSVSKNASSWLSDTDVATDFLNQ